jgi:5-hydroxyisourate hydrolase
MSPITTHILDTSLGRPAAGVAVVLEGQKPDGTWSELARGVTDSDGRLRDLLAAGSLSEGAYKLTFETGSYFAGQNQKTFYPRVTIVFEVADRAQHHHVPLLLSPHGYTTYRGS